MSEQAESNVVEFTELKFPPIEYGVTEAALAELRERFKEPDASTEEGYEHCKDGCRELTSLRTALETRRKDLKAPALDWGRKVDKLAKNLIRDIKAIEGPVRNEKERVDEIKQAEARKLAEVEQARIDDIKANIEKITATAREQNPSDTASDYQQHIAWLTELAITEDVFGEFVDDAKTARDAALFKLTQWHEQAVQREADDQRRADEQAELDRKQKELDEREAEQREESERLEKEKNEAEERRLASEKEEQDELDRKQREKDEAEKERINNIRGAIDLIKSVPSMSQDMTAESIDGIIAKAKEKRPDEAVFQEFLPDAMRFWQESIDTLTGMAKDARKHEEKTRRDEEARLPDRDKLIRWCDALEAIPEPEVLNDKAQKLLKRYAGDLSKLTGKLRSDIGKL